MRIHIVAAFGAASMLAGCVTTETVSFKASNPQQRTIMRDGQPAITSRQKSSIVLVRPASRQIQSGGRPVFVVGLNNTGREPIDFSVRQIRVSQIVEGQEFPMAVVPYETLAQEEKSRQVAAAILTGVAAGANSYSASRAGYGHYTTPRGHVGTSYSPTAAAIAQNTAAAQNDAMISATIEQGQMNMASLEQNVLKDNTLMPGEWVGGQLHISPPKSSSSGNQKSYSIVITVGTDRHLVEVTQSPAGA